LLPFLYIKGGIKMRKRLWKKGLVLGMILVFLAASVTLGVSAPYVNHQLPRVVQHRIQAIQQDGIGQPCLVGNALLSSNTGNDYHPRMTTNGLGHTIVVYEQEIDADCKQIPVVYSADHGQTWIMQFLFDSINFTSGSGVLQYPDIVYNAPHDMLWLTMIDPHAEMYNSGMSFIPGDIAHAENVPWWGISTCLFNYSDGGAACTNNFFLALATADECSGYYGLQQIFQLFWCTSPDFGSPPPTVDSFNVDFQSVHKSAPATEVEMDSNANQIFIVCEKHLDSGTKITIKTNVMDEGLITSGERQNNMSKYSDPEQMPGEYLGFGTDPDVSGSGNKVCVVYVEEGNVICKSSTTSAVYDPGFNWQVSTVETDASAPAVYMQGDKVSCAYVKGGNLYLKVSNDGGVTWEAAEQKNDVVGTVVAEKGAVDIGKTGITFTDARDGNYDIYFSSVTLVLAPQIVIDSISGGIGVKAVITNYGDAPAENFNWSITTEGIVFIGGRGKTGTASLAPDASMMIKKFMVGFGAVTVTIIAETVTKTQRFIVFSAFFIEIEKFYPSSFISTIDSHKNTMV
jgi:hypothetical protein